MRVVVITPPDALVSLQEAKDHLRVTTDDEDALIAVFVAAASAHVDGPMGWLGRSIGPQTLEARFSAADGQTVRLPYPPVIDITGVQYEDASAGMRAGDPGDFRLSGDEIEPIGNNASWSGGANQCEVVRIRYRAGYETVPAPVKVAVLLMTGDLFRNRTTVVSGLSVTQVPISVTVTALLQPFRLFA
jgi:uncharacterized phiE125 gp8 family phage protein